MAAATFADSSYRRRGSMFGDSFLDLAEATFGETVAHDWSKLSSSSDLLTPKTSQLNQEQQQQHHHHHSLCGNSDGLNAGKGKRVRLLVPAGSLSMPPPPSKRRCWEDRGGESDNDNNNENHENRLAQLTRALNAAASSAERTEALRGLIAALDHNDRNHHHHRRRGDAEIDDGIRTDVALVKHLMFLRFKTTTIATTATTATNGRTDPPSKDEEERAAAIAKEIGDALTALELLYGGASSDAVGRSFNRIGKDLLRILMDLIAAAHCCFPEKTDNKRGGGCRFSYYYYHSRSSSTLLLNKATKIFGHFARVGRLARPLADTPGFLDCVLGVIAIRRDCRRLGRGDDDEEEPGMQMPLLGPFEAGPGCFWTIANLACDAGNMTKMHGYPGLVEALIDALVASLPPRNDDGNDDNDGGGGASVERTTEILRSSSIAARALLNLSWSSENKILMSERRPLLDALCQIVSNENPPGPRTRKRHHPNNDNVRIQTRLRAAACLRNICRAPWIESKTFLCLNHENGRVLDALASVIIASETQQQQQQQQETREEEEGLNDGNNENESSKAVIDLCFSAVRNLAIDETAAAFANRPALILALKNVLLSEDDHGREGTVTTATKATAAATTTTTGSFFSSARRQDASATISVLERAVVATDKIPTLHRNPKNEEQEVLRDTWILPTPTPPPFF